MNEQLITTIVLTILSLGAIQGAVFGITTWFKGERWLSVWVMLFVFEVMNKLLLINFIWPTFSQWFGYWFSFDLLYGPLLYLWVYQLITGNSLNKWQCFHFAPFIILLAFKLPALLSWSLEERFSVIQGVLDGGQWLFPSTAINGLTAYILYVPTIYSLMALYRLIAYRFWFNHQQSNALEVRFDWLVYMVVLQVLMWLLIISAVSFINLGSINNWLISYIPAILWLNGLAWMSMLYHQLVATKEPMQSALKNSQPPAFDKQLAEQITGELEQAMINGLYKQPKLSLDQLAQQIGIASYLISQVLNEHLNCNFFDYINGHRIKAIQADLQQNSFQYNKQTILEIAFANGFNSKSTFNMVFKKQVGITPSQYRKQQIA